MPIWSKKLGRRLPLLERTRRWRTISVWLLRLSGREVQSRPSTVMVSVKMCEPVFGRSLIHNPVSTVSATIVEIPDFGNILLDAGEGTLGQMHRRYGSELWPKVLSKTKIMVISHMHADHHIGLRRVLEERLKVRPDCQLKFTRLPLTLRLFLSTTRLRCYTSSPHPLSPYTSSKMACRWTTKATRSASSTLIT
jgi:hypothetical protein